MGWEEEGGDRKKGKEEEGEQKPNSGSGIAILYRRRPVGFENLKHSPSRRKQTDSVCTFN